MRLVAQGLRISVLELVLAPPFNEVADVGGTLLRCAVGEYVLAAVAIFIGSLLCQGGTGIMGGGVHPPIGLNFNLEAFALWR